MVAPHDCSRCRAIEAGYAGPYTPTQLLELGLVELPLEAAVNAERAEAALKVDLARCDYAQAMRDVAEIRDVFTRQSLRVAGQPVRSRARELRGLRKGKRIARATQIADSGQLQFALTSRLL